jgi:hypothetical protein
MFPAFAAHQFILIAVGFPLKGYVIICLFAIKAKFDQPFNHVPQVKEYVTQLFHLSRVNAFVPEKPVVNDNALPYE